MLAVISNKLLQTHPTCLCISQVLVRALSSFQSAEEIRAALHTTRLLGMLFSGSGSAGHWNFVDLEELGVRELFGSCAAVIVSSAV